LGSDLGEGIHYPAMSERFGLVKNKCFIQKGNFGQQR